MVPCFSLGVAGLTYRPMYKEEEVEKALVRLLPAATAEPLALSLPLGDNRQPRRPCPGRRVVPARSSHHGLSCSATILAAVRQKLHSTPLSRFPEPPLTFFRKASASTGLLGPGSTREARRLTSCHGVHHVG